jgi:hypothetical protein
LSSIVLVDRSHCALISLCAFSVFVPITEFLPNAVDHWDAARALECINVTSAFATQAYRDAAQTLCSDGPAIKAMFASFSAKSVRPQDRDRFACPPGILRDEFLALLSAEVIALVHRQAHQKPPDALLSVLELLEDKMLGMALQIKLLPNACSTGNWVCLPFFSLAFFFLQKMIGMFFFISFPMIFNLMVSRVMLCVLS